MTAAVYVTGHGYGHATRTAELLKHLLRIAPGLRVRLRTSAPHWLFDGLPVSLERAAIDTGMVERRNGLDIDAAATQRAVRELYLASAEVVAREAEAVRGADLVLADAPWLAADVAEAIGASSVLCTNFTWDWIYEPFVPDVAPVRASYAKFGLCIRLPLGQPEWGVFREVTDVPVIARRGTPIPRSDGRIRVLVAQRGGVPPSAMAPVAARDLVFLEGASFPDMVASADVVVSKIGYGIVADCMANGSRLLYPRRRGFRETGPALEQAAPYLPAREIPQEDFESGNWAESIRALAAVPVPERRPPVDGAARAARVISRFAGLRPASM